MSECLLLKGKGEFDIAIPVWEKYSLSIKEAAEYYGLGEKRIRQIISENQDSEFVLEIGTHVRIKRKKFELYLDASSVV